MADKAVDIAGLTVARRWAVGQAAAQHVIDRVVSGALPVAAAGLTVSDPDQPDR